MADARHQTTVLARGRHRDATQGVCTLELSSMLADERFTDRPQNVCPALAAFVRGYNDAIPTAMRQELFGLAATLVGSRTADPLIRQTRYVELLAYAHDVWAQRRFRMPWPPTFTPENAFGDLEEAGAYVGRAARRNRAVHERTLAFLERAALHRGEPSDPTGPPAVVPAAPEPPVAGAAT